MTTRRPFPFPRTFAEIREITPSAGPRIVASMEDITRPDPQLDEWKREWELRRAIDAMERRRHPQLYGDFAR